MTQAAENIATLKKYPLEHIPLCMIVPGKNPRKFFDPKKMEELERSVVKQGVIQPIVVRPTPDNKMFQITAGERRYRAAFKALGEHYEIPCHVIASDDEESEIIALVENSNRDNMSVTEEAESAGRILNACKGDRAEAIRVLGWSESKFNRRIALLNLTQAVIAALNERKIKVGHAELLAAAPKEIQEPTLDLILKHSLSVEFVKEKLLEKSLELGRAVFDTQECSSCQHNSNRQATLFETNIGQDGRCTNGDCFNNKTRQAIESQRLSLAEDFPAVRVFQVGEQDSFIQLTGEGNLGVGEKQYAACQACSNFGAAISAIPGEEGRVEKSVCFDLSCQQQKVAQRLKEEKKAQETKSCGEKSEAKTKKESASPKKAEQKPDTSTISLSNKLTEYRHKVWETAAKKELVAQSDKAQAFLVHLALKGECHYIQGTKMTQFYGKITGEDTGAKSVSPADVFSLSEEQKEKSLAAISVAAIDELPERRLIETLKFLDVNLAAHWSMKSDEFFNLFTRSELKVLCKQVGLDDAVDDFDKVMSKKKGETVEALLKSRFEFEGVLPDFMKF